MESDNVIEVNGEKYAQKQSKKSSTPMSHKMFSLKMMAMTMIGGMNFGEPAYSRAPNVDIVKEYALIQQKKSTLSKWERDWVIHQFEMNFTKVEESR